MHCRDTYCIQTQTNTHTFFNTLSDSVLRRSSDSSPSSFSPSEDKEEEEGKEKRGGIEGDETWARLSLSRIELLSCHWDQTAPQRKLNQWLTTDWFRPAATFKEAQNNRHWGLFILYMCVCLTLAAVHQVTVEASECLSSSGQTDRSHAATCLASRSTAACSTDTTAD